MTVRIAHDFICPWCWIGLLQARKLQQEFGVDIEWIGYELFPNELEWPDFQPAKSDPENKPKTLTRLQFLEYADNTPIPQSDRPKKMRSHNAHLAVELAKKHGIEDSLVEALYRAFWQEGQNINDVDVLEKIAKGRFPSDVDLRAAIAAEEGAENIVHFDDDAYKGGVYNVPTFFIGDERLAEQPYGVLKAAVEKSVAANQS
jgi:predicted DsbA family dithiol-disulfide isomerase